MQYRLRTLLIVLALAAIVVATYWQVQKWRASQAKTEAMKAIERRYRQIAGTNAGSNKPLTGEVSGWTYQLGGQDRIAHYQFNESGSVVATVGTPGRPDYPAMFWRIDEKNQIVVSDERDFSTIAEAWTVLSIEGKEVKVKNAINNREETYFRKQHWQPSSARRAE